MSNPPLPFTDPTDVTNNDHIINPFVLNTDVGRFIDQIGYAIHVANRGLSSINPEVLKIDGMSTHRVRHFLNALGMMSKVRYLEVGSYKGSTLCSVLAGNNVELAVAYENYTEFDQTTAKEDLKRNIDRFRGSTPVDLMECDFFTNPPKDSGFNVYFYDGAHCRETQYYALGVAKSYLAKYFVFLVDDFYCNISCAREMSFKAIHDFGFKIHLYIDLAPGQLNYHTGQGLFVLENLPKVS